MCSGSSPSSAPNIPESLYAHKHEVTCISRYPPPFLDSHYSKSIHPNMACTNLYNPLRQLVRDAGRSREIPSFLVPAISQRWHTRHNATLAAPAPQSRIGRSPITIPPEVSLRFYDLPKSNSRSRNPDTAITALEVTGPLGMVPLEKEAIEQGNTN